MEVDWVFLDLGNVLVDERAAQKDRMNQVVDLFSNKQVTVTAGQVEQALIAASLSLAPRIIVGAVHSLTNDADIADYVLHNLKYNKALELPYSNAGLILEYLYPKYKIGIIANQSPGTEKRLREYKMLDYVSLLFSSAEVGLKKPDPKIFHLALEKAKCAPERAVMIGDRLDNDIDPANRIGMKTIRLLQGFHKVQISANEYEQADNEISNLMGLKEIL